MLHRRYGKPRRITRREMLQRSLAAAAGAADQRALQRSAQGRRRQRVVVDRRRLQRPGGGVRAVARRLRRHRRRGAQPRRRPRHHFSDLVPGKNVEGGGELIGSNHPAWVAYAKQFKPRVPRRHRGRGSRGADRPRRQAADRPTSPSSCGRRWRRRSTPIDRRRGEGRCRRAVDGARTPRRSTSGRWPTGSTS